jgi:DNA helicase HerA-like ATPase
VGNAEELTKAFYAWEIRGRGWQSYDYPVVLEPVFLPFPGHVIARPAPNDGRRETRLSSFIGRFLGRADESRAPEAPEPLEPDPPPFEDEAPLREIRVTLPEKVSVSPALSAQLLLALSPSRFPLAFEVLGLPDALRPQITVRLPDRERVMGQLRAFFPDVLLSDDGEGLRPTWRGIWGEGAVREFGLAREFMLPLGASRDFRPDPLLSVFAGLAEVRYEELACFQVLFEPVASPWAEHMLRAVTTDQGDPFLLDAPEVTTLAKEKAAQPLYAVVVRLAAKARDAERTWEILRSVAGGLNAFAYWNELLPLSLDEEIDLEADLLGRTTHRAGMLLGQDELAGLVHLPHESVRLVKLRREVARTKSAPPSVLGDGVALGTNAHDGRRVEARLPRDLRMRHLHVVGASGSGKSTLLTQMILNDLASGEGVGVLDPHGDLVDEILARFPREREQDLILFDPSDEGVALGWNMLEARTEIEKTLLSSDLVGVFRRLSTSWGDQMNSVLANAIVAFLESDRGGTLLELRRFLVDREFRAEFLTTVSDSEVLYYWQKEFPLLVGKPQGPILTRLDTFLRPKLVRRVVVERENRLDFRGMVDQGQVFLAKLSQGALGEENASLLGSLLVSAFHQAAISRQDLAPGARRHFFLYLDEFHEFATPSMAALLTGARKYRLGLTLAHQELRQLEAKNREVASALLGNAATRIVFRVGEDDAKSLERGFSSFVAADLLNLEVGEALVRVERSENDFNLRTVPLPGISPEDAHARQEELLALTRTRFPREKEPAPAPSLAPASTTKPASEPEKDPGRARDTSRKPRTAPAPSPPAPLGRGGPEHQYLQEVVKRWAESKGFRATVEEPTSDGEGRVDVGLAGHGLRIACEISVTSTPEQEAGNVEKCLRSGFDLVAVLSTRKTHLAKLEKAVRARVAGTDLARVSFFTPEALFSFLEGRLVPQPEEKMVAGYKVRVNYTKAGPEEEGRRSRMLAEVVGKSIRRLKRDTKGEQE